VHRLWSILFAVVNLAALGLFVVAPSYGWWLPKDVSTTGAGVDFLFYVILYVTGFFFVLTEAILVYCMWVYAREEGRKSIYVHGNHQLEMFWTGVTAVILLVLAFWQIPVWAEIKFPTNDITPDHIVEVSARQFEWRIRYPNAATLEQLRKDYRSPTVMRKWAEEGSPTDIKAVNELHIWKGDPDRIAAGDQEGRCRVRVLLKPRDVLHSFFLPTLRIKQDAVPGKTIPVWFEAKEHNVEWDEATKAWRFLREKTPDSKDDPQGKSMEYPLACAELCGWGHYKMQGRLWVHKDKAEYDRWLRQAEQEEGKRQP